MSYVRNKEKLFTEWGLSERFRDRDSLAVNLYGASGTGKTMAAHAIAQELQLKIICVDYADIESKYVGETSKNLSSLFRKAAESGAVIFFDEADAILSKRVTNMSSATDVSVNQTRSVLPDKDLREKLWRFYMPAKLPVDPAINFHELSEKFDGISASDIANAVFSAAISAANDGAEVIGQRAYLYNKLVQFDTSKCYQ